MAEERFNVTQRARDAAESAYLECYDDAPNDAWLGAMLAGKHDDDPLVQAFAKFEHETTASLEADKAALVEALALSVKHIEHMAAWIANQHAGYSFESLGEDMPNVYALLSTHKEEEA